MKTNGLLFAQWHLWISNSLHWEKEAKRKSIYSTILLGSKRAVTPWPMVKSSYEELWWETGYQLLRSESSPRQKAIQWAGPCICTSKAETLGVGLRPGFVLSGYSDQCSEMSVKEESAKSRITFLWKDMGGSELLFIKKIFSVFDFVFPLQPCEDYQGTGNKYTVNLSTILSKLHQNRSTNQPFSCCMSYTLPVPQKCLNFKRITFNNNSTLKNIVFFLHIASLVCYNIS